MKSVFIKKFKVENFRNLSSEIVEFSDQINIVTGDNGNGKTNLLEAIFFLFQGKTFRKKNGFPQILSSDCVKSEILFNTLLSKDSETLYLSSIQGVSKSVFYLNNKKSSRVKLNSLFISPHDAFLYFNDSLFRREKMNTVFSMVNNEYKELVARYNKVLKQKNSMLKGKISFNNQLLDIYNNELSELNYKIIKHKELLLNESETHLKTIFMRIFGENFTLKLALESKFLGFSKGEIQEFYKKNIDKELILRTTSEGQHKDDYKVLLDGFVAQEYASLGQQKMCYFSILFAFSELICYKFNESPIVLFDDVSGELDHIRLGKLLKYLGSINSQVFITSANEKAFLGLTNKEVKVIKICDGKYI